jgi:hypothetical protein
MRRKVGKDWEEMGPSSPMGLGHFGERHSKGRPDLPLDNAPAPMGTLIPLAGHRPMQSRPSAEIEVAYHE